MKTALSPLRLANKELKAKVFGSHLISLPSLLLLATFVDNAAPLSELFRKNVGGDRGSLGQKGRYDATLGRNSSHAGGGGQLGHGARPENRNHLKNGEGSRVDLADRGSAPAPFIESFGGGLYELV